MDTYRIELRHEGLHKYRVITGRDRSIVEEKARAQTKQWDEAWARRQARDQRTAEREATRQRKEENKQIAEERTEEAQRALDELSRLLMHTLSVDDAVPWEDLKQREVFGRTCPEAPPPPAVPPEPDPKHLKYKPNLSLIDHVFPSRRARKEQAARERLRIDRAAFERTRQNLERIHQEEVLAHERSLAAWQTEGDEFNKRQSAHNATIDAARERYLLADPEAIAEYCDLVLSRSEYPDTFPQEFQVVYVPTSRTMVVDYALPGLRHLPVLREVKFVQSRGEFVETQLSEKELGRVYDAVVYQITLRTLHELFEADAIGALDSVVFNGWVRSLDSGTGNEVNACILSLQTRKAEFLAINLSSG